MRLTDKQKRVLRIIAVGNDDGSPCDMDQLVERMESLGDPTTKQAMQFIIRSLVTKGLIEKQGREKRRLRSRMTYLPTEAGFSLNQTFDVKEASGFAK